MTREEAMREAAFNALARLKDCDEPWSDAPLTLAGADAERARIVAWLRAKAKDFDKRGASGRANQHDALANQIEAGTHWRKDGG